MGSVVNMADAKIAGTVSAARLALIVRILSHRSEFNTAEEAAKLAAAKRLLAGK